MRKYRMHNGKSLIGFAIIWFIAFAFITYLRFEDNGEVVEESGFLARFGLVFIPFALIGLGFLIVGIFFQIRVSLALKGEEITGIVKDIYIPTGRGGTFYTAVIEYNNSNGELENVLCDVTGPNYVYFQKEAEIPLRYNGKYAYYDINKVKEHFLNNK